MLYWFGNDPVKSTWRQPVDPCFDFLMSPNFEISLFWLINVCGWLKICFWYVLEGLNSPLSFMPLQIHHTPLPWPPPGFDSFLEMSRNHAFLTSEMYWFTLKICTDQLINMLMQQNTENPTLWGRHTGKHHTYLHGSKAAWADAN